MKFTLKITPIGVTLFTVLVITQVVFAILTIAKAITWKLIFVLLPHYYPRYLGVFLLICFTYMYLKLTREERIYNKLMRDCNRHKTNNYGPRITPEILAMMAEEVDKENDIS